MSLVRAQQFIRPMADKAIFFLCPYSTTIQSMRLIIRSLVRSGYTVVAYEFDNDVWTDGRLDLLPLMVDDTKRHVRQTVKELKANGYREFGFVGSSLGAFVIYNCLGTIRELAWGILNTGGDAAKAVWRDSKLRRGFVMNGYTEDDLVQAWHDIQYPPLGNLKGKRLLLISSLGDKLTPFHEARHSFELIKKSGAKTILITHRRIGHTTTIIRNLLRVRKLINLVATT